eukprot:19691-Heterococcus_DN1.PRE.3
MLYANAATAVVMHIPKYADGSKSDELYHIHVRDDPLMTAWGFCKLYHALQGSLYDCTERIMVSPHLDLLKSV